MVRSYNQITVYMQWIISVPIMLLMYGLWRGYDHRLMCFLLCYVILSWMCYDLWVYYFCNYNNIDTVILHGMDKNVFKLLKNPSNHIINVITLASSVTLRRKSLFSHGIGIRRGFSTKDVLCYVALDATVYQWIWLYSLVHIT